MKESVLSFEEKTTQPWYLLSNYRQVLTIF